MTSPFQGRPLTRRQLLASLGLAGAALAAGSPAAAALSRGRKGARLVEAAASTRAAGSDLGAVEHIVFLMMENRSYDHYFGAYPKGRGFDDHPAKSLGVFAQDYPGGAALSPPNVLLPFHLDSAGGYECTDDLTHDWGPQHLCWNGGKMDSFVKVHTSSTYEGANGAMTMGYYDRSDLPFYYALADAFTLCDGYHASILGPTHPNRLMANSGTIDPAGTQGGPVTDTNETPDVLWNCTWPTMQEVLQDAGIPWKVYHPFQRRRPGQVRAVDRVPDLGSGPLQPDHQSRGDGGQRPRAPVLHGLSEPASALYQNAFLPTFPTTFVSDVNSGSAPERVVDHPSPRLRRAPLVVAGQRHVLHVARSRRADRQSHAVVQDGPVPDVRRERRMVRPCASADRSCRDARRVSDRVALFDPRARLRLGRPRHQRPSRPGHARALPGDLALQPGRPRRHARPSITPRNCSWWRNGSAWRCPMSPPGARRPSAISPRPCSPGPTRPQSPPCRHRRFRPSSSPGACSAGEPGLRGRRGGPQRPHRPDHAHSTGRDAPRPPRTTTADFVDRAPSARFSGRPGPALSPPSPRTTGWPRCACRNDPRRCRVSARAPATPAMPRRTGRHLSQRRRQIHRSFGCRAAPCHR